MYNINSNILSRCGLNADQLWNAIKAINPATGFAGSQMFLDVENKYGINALFVAAHAAIESAWGNSYFAKNRNNLFGFNAYDSDPNQAASYPSQAASCDFYGAFLKKYYLTAGAIYYNGPTPHGVFVRYSSSHDAEAQSVVNLMNQIGSKANAPAPSGTPVAPPLPQLGSSANHYVARPGDSMSKIAATHGLTLMQLEALNPRAGHPAGNYSVIWPGDVFNLGGAAPQPPAASGEVDYVIKPGDVLSIIAPRFGTTVDQLVQWNKTKYPSMTRDYIQAGWTIRVR